MSDGDSQYTEDIDRFFLFAVSSLTVTVPPIYQLFYSLNLSVLTSTHKP